MIGIVLITHGALAQGLLSACQLIFDEDLEQVEVLSYETMADYAQLPQRIQQAVQKVHREEGVLLFTDLLGATPYNLSLQQWPWFQSQKIPVHVITGTNLSMLLEALSLRDTMALDLLASTVSQAGKEGIQSFSAIIPPPTTTSPS